jgi:glycerol-3-phosphate dehydrogenase
MNQQAPGSVWFRWPGVGCDASHRLTANVFSLDRPYDVAIVGAGVVGCALAYQLSQYQLRTILIDRAFDFGEGTSKGNSAIIHTGFDATPGSVEAQFVTTASRQWPELAQKLKIPFKAVSALMLALDEEQWCELSRLHEKALANGVADVQIVSSPEALRLEPNITASVRGGLLVPRESIVDPFTTSIAYAEVALQNGVDVAFGLAITGIEDASATIKVLATDSDLRIPARHVINACGLGSRQFVERYHGEHMDINPRRGQFVVYDRESSRLVSRILLPIPTPITKGMLVSPTIFGNLLAGPTAEDLAPHQVNATETTAEGIASVLASARQLCPGLSDQPVIATYAGLRCNCTQGSYWMRFNDGHPRLVTLSGIRSTGLTASNELAKYVVQQMASQCGLTLEPSPLATDSRTEARWPGWWRRPFDDPHRLAARPDYGRIVCTCENISHGEIQDALDGCPGVATLDGLKRRTRVLTGRCQGFNCCVPTAEMIAHHYRVPLDRVTKRGPGTEFISSVDARPPEANPAPQACHRSVASHYRVIIVGAGPAGIGTAVGLARLGIDGVLLVERADEVGGVPAKFAAKPGGVPTFLAWRRGQVVFGRQLAEGWKHELADTSTAVCLQCHVLDVDRASRQLSVVSPHGREQISAEAIVFACGAREKNRSERGWIYGDRPGRVFYTMQLLQLMDCHHLLPMRNPAIVGSDLIAYSAAAKLRAAGSLEPNIYDRSRRPVARLWERLYFSWWSRPRWHAATEGLAISSTHDTTSVQVGHVSRNCDGVLISGELLPNSELISATGLAVMPSTRVPVSKCRNELSDPGWFLAGAVGGGFHGAVWCYRDGLRAAGAVARFLRG